MKIKQHINISKLLILYLDFRYADLYAASILNLLYYPFCYMFRAPPMLMPHESTVAQDKANNFMMPNNSSNHFTNTPAKPSSPVTPNVTPVSTPVKPRLTKRLNSQVPNLYANPPEPENQTHELDDDDHEDENNSHESS